MPSNNNANSGNLITFLYLTLAVLLQEISPEERAKLREEFMREFDENRDGRIEMMEVNILLSHKSKCHINAVKRVKYLCFNN
mgnify:CR=1 FL=1